MDDMSVGVALALLRRDLCVFLSQRLPLIARGEYLGKRTHFMAHLLLPRGKGVPSPPFILETG